MAGEVWVWLPRLKNVEREYNSMRIAAGHLLRSIDQKTVELDPELSRANVKEAAEKLEMTYIMRLFSQFERTLKRFLKAKKRKVPRYAETLLNRVAARVGFAGDILTNAHKVRDYRNDLAHDLQRGNPPLTIREATNHLTTYLYRLQQDW